MNHGRRQTILVGLVVVMTLGGGYSDNAWHAQYASIRALLEAYGQAQRSARQP